MAKIVDLARECKARTTCMGWDHAESLFYEIESQLGALRMENQAQHLNVQALRQEIQDLKRDIKDGSASTLDYKEPEPELQRGDFVSYMDDGQKIKGIFHHYDGAYVWAYWQFETVRTAMPKDRVTPEFRPEK